MARTSSNQWTITKFDQDTHLLTWIKAFLVDRKAQGLSEGTLYFYKKKLKLFTEYCDAQVLTQITNISPSFLRQYMLYLEDAGHNEGGRHACYRALKTFLFWWEDEVEVDGWSNPIRKVKPPKIPVTLIEPVPLDDIKAMVKTCDKSFTGLRDKAILLALLDTGARAQEFLGVQLGDVNQVSGEIIIQRAKGGKYRIVFLGKAARKAMRAYIRHRSDQCEALWVSLDREPLTYWGLREIIRRRSKRGKVVTPPLHSFRRAFAINMLRAGVDVFSLQKLMGHADLQVLRRYLAQTTEDIAKAHRIGSPVDTGKL